MGKKLQIRLILAGIFALGMLQQAAGMHWQKKQVYHKMYQDTQPLLSQITNPKIKNTPRRISSGLGEKALAVLFQSALSKPLTNLFMFNQKFYEDRLNCAISNNNLGLVQILTGPIDLQILQNLNSWPLLHVACGYGHLEIAQWLIKKGFSIHDLDILGETPLDAARKRGRHALADFLKQESTKLESSPTK